MFARTRHTLRAGHNNRRTLKQRGGGTTLIGFCSWRPETERKTALEDWKTVITDPSGTFGFLLSGTEITEKQYVSVVERQDDLFMLAMDLIYVAIGAEKGNEADIIEKAKVLTPDKQNQITTYIKDVISIVQLEVDLTAAFNNTDKFKGTKFDKLLTFANEPLLHLLINPQRVKNQFVENMARFIVFMKHFKTLDTLTSDELMFLMAIRYDSIMKANALAATSMDLRDGPHLFISQQKVSSILGTNKGNKSEIFMYHFLLRCADKFLDKDGKLNTGGQINSGIKHIFINDNAKDFNIYSILSAFVYKSTSDNILNDLDNVLKILEKNIPKPYSPSNESILQVSNYITQGLKRYITHLAYKIKEYETSPEFAEIKKATTPSVALPSSQGNGASGALKVQ